MKRDEIREMIHGWAMDQLNRLKPDDESGNIARTEIIISAVLAREAGVDLSAWNFEPSQNLRVMQHWNFKERTPRRYFLFFVDGDQSEPFLLGDGEFLA